MKMNRIRCILNELEKNQVLEAMLNYKEQLADAIASQKVVDTIIGHDYVDYVNNLINPFEFKAQLAVWNMVGEKIDNKIHEKFHNEFFKDEIIIDLVDTIMNQLNMRIKINSSKNKRNSNK